MKAYFTSGFSRSSGPPSDRRLFCDGQFLRHLGQLALEARILVGKCLVAFCHTFPLLGFGAPLINLAGLYAEIVGGGSDTHSFSKLEGFFAIGIGVSACCFFMSVAGFVMVHLVQSSSLTGCPPLLGKIKVNCTPKVGHPHPTFGVFS